MGKKICYVWNCWDCLGRGNPICTRYEASIALAIEACVKDEDDDFERTSEMSDLLEKIPIGRLEYKVLLKIFGKACKSNATTVVDRVIENLLGKIIIENTEYNYKYLLKKARRSVFGTKGMSQKLLLKFFEDRLGLEELKVLLKEAEGMEVYNDVLEQLKEKFPYCEESRESYRMMPC